MGCHFLVQGVFLTQGLNPDLLHCRQILYHVRHQGSSVIRQGGIKIETPNLTLLKMFSLPGTLNLQPLERGRDVAFAPCFLLSPLPDPPEVSLPTSGQGRNVGAALLSGPGRW